ncbi:substrate-binding domain-containing protein [Pullulanibacillus sp. KACC 23026]|uniref:substrate-binding domain-containing protein n=1 Tax=Pullulanibacillus sp. KACC 23026 TaxID=3028315 RepID=UPI0023AF8855|nr:substrate-binding domain-containing protein [Pullulanibacillus sp. KACC 23026]WEG13369.1 substrate-binding domain-containing protein [Pullulanibacillus sp. KACC 23026]
MKKKITMQDIADHLNISKNSVSQALSGKDGVSEETRQLVQKVANELGYAYPSKKPGKAQSQNIALIASDFTISLKGFFGEIYLSIEKELQKRGMHLFIKSIDQQSIDHLKLPSLFDLQEIDGVIIMSHLSREYIQKVMDTGLPTVLIDHHDPHLKVDSILTNNRFGAYLAVEHLIQLNHRDIAFVGNTKFSPSYYERLEGYKLGLNTYGIEIKEEFIFDSVEETDTATESLISNLKKQPTAWFCVNDGFGYLISSHLQLKNIKVPDDASVCSYDNGQLSRIATPKITTMGIDLEYYGQIAVEQLLWRMENINKPYQELLLPSTLIKRQSTSTAPIK